jgi:UDP:flavonoid glycosyltransferase YjiC (YdhE family)
VRYLFVTVDGGGNLYPALALGRRLAARGHVVRFLGGTCQRRAIEDAGFRFAGFRVAPDLDLSDPSRSPVRDWEDDPETVFAALCDHIWFGPAAAFGRDLMDEVARDPVDAVLVDYFLPGALAGAEAAGVPAAALWHTTFGEWAVWNRGLSALNQARTDLGLATLGDVYEQYRRTKRVLVTTLEEFDFALERLSPPANVRHIGPQFADVAGLGPSADSRRHPPLVLVSLSTSYQGQEDLLRRLVEGLAGLPIRVLVTTGFAVGLDLPAAENVEIRSWVPHESVLPATSLVVTHAGMGTVMTAMAHGVPLLCLPMGRDQHGNAARVEALGVGALLADSASPEAIAASAQEVLADANIAARASLFAEVIAATARRDEGVHELEALPGG